jgi:hypothetical protein
MTYYAPVYNSLAKITLPRGLSIKSGGRAPMARYNGFIIVFNRGARIKSPKNILSVTPICPKRNIFGNDTSV